MVYEYKGFRQNQIQTTVKQSKRNSRRKLWSDKQMAATIDAVVNDGLSSNQAADNFEVSCTTLKDRLSGRVTHEVNPGPKPYLTKDEERELADHLF